MSTSEVQIIREKILGYNLFDTLTTRMQIIIKGGVSESMVRKALRVGPKTKTSRIIIKAALRLIDDHENSIEEYLVKDPSQSTQAAA